MYFLGQHHRGIKNTYRENIPFSEKLIKDLGFQIREIINFVLNGLTRKTLLVYPDFPSSKTVIRKICRRLNINLTNKIDRKYTWVLYYEDETFRTRFEKLEALQDRAVVNLHSRDISKTYIERVHWEIFGYNTEIDPMNYSGVGVRKSNLNARHDGEVLDFPISATEANSVYQKLIDNKVNETEVLDMRVPIINYKIPLLYLKYRMLSERFKNTTTRTEMVNINEHLSTEEQKQIIEFARKKNLEYGELDVLRDSRDKRIYIVDVNNTPFGPPANISKTQGKEAVKILANAFREAFLG